MLDHPPYGALKARADLAALPDNAAVLLQQRDFREEAIAVLRIVLGDGDKLDWPGVRERAIKLVDAGS